MTPPGFYKGQKKNPASAEKTDWIPWVPLGTLVSGLSGSWLAFHFGQKDLSFGLGWGSLFNVLNFYSLKILTEKVLTRGEVEGRKFFWFLNMIRWMVMAFGCWWFLSVSPLCLAGAGAGYFWFLLILGWAGWRSDPLGKKINGK